MIFTKETPRTTQPFADVAFNDTGDLLYAWATASLNEPSAGLFIYRTDSLTNDLIESQSYYNPSFNGNFNTRLIPFNTHNGCIVAVGNQYYYPAVTSTGPENDTTRQPQNYSKAIRKSYLEASTMYNNHSLLAIQRASTFHRRYRLVEHPLHFGETCRHFRDPIELAKVETKVDGNSEIKAIQAGGGDICIFIFNLDGRYEMIRFARPAPEANEESKNLMRHSYSRLTESSRYSGDTVAPGGSYSAMGETWNARDPSSNRVSR
ncbi:hypothetical protein B0T25DRAFT_32262 [Lasiosphaeria hispida]|uniref:Uncharacterized protein n=1 Tax=Lasiosphaeria hispida TaxID=260671 RepID=A0AAJ0HUS2_9PEZI|nr:hypothetical protein B0T25DRAFT_32262 [Lasiosphaeria hispida]